MHSFEALLQHSDQEDEVLAATGGNGSSDINRLRQPAHDEIVDYSTQEQTVGLNTASAPATAAEKGAPSRENPTFVDEVAVVVIGGKAYRISLTSYWDVRVKYDPRFKGSSRHSQTVIERPDASKVRVLQVSAAERAVSRRRAVREDSLNLKFVTQHIYGQRISQEAGFTVELSQFMEALQRRDAIMELEPVGDDVPDGYLKRHYPDVLALALPDAKDPQTLNVLVLVAPLEEEAEHLVVSDTLGQAQDILQRTLDEILDHLPVSKKYEYLAKFQELDAQALEDEPDDTHRRARRVIKHLRYLAEHEYKVQPVAAPVVSSAQVQPAVTVAAEAQPATVHQETVPVATESRWQRLLAWIRSWSTHNKEAHEVALDEPVQTTVPGLAEAKVDSAESHTKALDEFITAIRTLLLTGIRNREKPFDARSFAKLYPHTQESFNAAVSKLRRDSGMSARQLHQAVMAELQKTPPTPEELGTLSLDSMYAHVRESLKFLLEIPAQDITVLTDNFFSLLIEIAAALEKKKTPLTSSEFDTRSYLVEAGMRLLETPDFTYEEIQDELIKRWLAEPGYARYDREGLRQIVAAVLTTSAREQLKDSEKKDATLSWHELQKLQAQLDGYIANKSEATPVPHPLIEHILRFKKAGLCRNALTRLYVINGDRQQRSDEGAAIIAHVYTEAAQLKRTVVQRLLGVSPVELIVEEPPQIKLLNTLGVLWEKTSQLGYNYNYQDFEMMRANVWQLVTEHGYTIEQIIAELQDKRGINGAKFILENAFADQVFEESQKLPEQNQGILKSYLQELESIVTNYLAWNETERTAQVTSLAEIFLKIRDAKIPQPILDRAVQGILEVQVRIKTDQVTKFMYDHLQDQSLAPEQATATLKLKLDRLFGLVPLTEGEILEKQQALAVKNAPTLQSLYQVIYGHVTSYIDYYDRADRWRSTHEAEEMAKLFRVLYQAGYTYDDLVAHYDTHAQKYRTSKIDAEAHQKVYSELRRLWAQNEQAELDWRHHQTLVKLYTALYERVTKETSESTPVEQQTANLFKTLFDAGYRYRTLTSFYRVKLADYKYFPDTKNENRDKVFAELKQLCMDFGEVFET